MSKEPLEFRVKEITVEANHKAWQQGTFQRGNSGGTGLTWKVVPPEGKSDWSPEEAMQVTLQVRREQERALVADAIARGAPEPDGGKDSLKGYDLAIKMLKGASAEEALEEVGTKE